MGSKPTDSFADDTSEVNDFESMKKRDKSPPRKPSVVAIAGVGRNSIAVSSADDGGSLVSSSMKSSLVLQNKVDSKTQIRLSKGSAPQSSADFMSEIGAEQPKQFKVLYPVPTGIDGKKDDRRLSVMTPDSLLGRSIDNNSRNANLK